MTSGRDGQYVAPRMRAQTAIALATAIVAIKAVLIGVAIRGWWTLAAGTRDGPGRQWFPGHAADGLALAVAFAAVSGRCGFRSATRGRGRRDGMRRPISLWCRPDMRSRRMNLT
jgi:hypothetical protein